MRVIERGSGTPLVFLHPFPFDADFWAAQMAVVPEGWHALAPDFRGFGRDGAADTQISGAAGIDTEFTDAELDPSPVGVEIHLPQ